MGKRFFEPTHQNAEAVRSHNIGKDVSGVLT